MRSYLTETAEKAAHDLCLQKVAISTDACIIVGAGPSGLATAACLKAKGIPSIVIERSACVGSLWKYRAYDRLHLHIPKQFCQLPMMPFPASYPTYPNRQQFLDYLEEYARHFEIEAHLNESVQTAMYCEEAEVWRVHTIATAKSSLNFLEEHDYVTKWLVVASGENAEIMMPNFSGMEEYRGNILHSSLYKNGEHYRDQKVLVVGCGNSGMEIALDLANYNAKPSLVVRGPVHILPREILGRSTFSVAFNFSKTLPLWLTDWLLVSYASLTLGNVAKYGLLRPKEGPMELKNKVGKTPILDVGTVDKIKRGHIKVVPGLQCFTNSGARFENGETQNYDAVILATGYRSNVPSWLQDENRFFANDGHPKTPFPNGWRGGNGLYAVGLSRRGLLGASMEAANIANDISVKYTDNCVQRAPMEGIKS